MDTESMSGKSPSKTRPEQAKDAFQQAMLDEMYGWHLFEREVRDYYLFAAHETGNSIWLRPLDLQEQRYEAFLVDKAYKFPAQRVIPGVLLFQHCEPIDICWLAADESQRIEYALKQGGKTLAQKVNKAFVEVLMKAVSVGARVQAHGLQLGTVLAKVSDDLSVKGFTADRFLFPQRYKNELLQQEIVVTDNEIQNSHYAGKTKTGLYAFWSEELPVDVALVFDSTAGVTITKGQRFWTEERSTELALGVCGKVYLNPIVKDTKSVIALEGIMQALGPETSLGDRVPMTEAERFFNKIKVEIEAGSIAEAFKEIALYDLEQARLAYSTGAFKACVIMLGAVLEGVMLGTIRRPEVLDRLRNDPNPPAMLKKLGLRDPNLMDKIAEELDFEDYKNIVHYLIPDIERLQVEGIQSFRNAVHPWKAVKEPALYADYDRARTRAMHHLTSLELLVHHVLSWSP